MKIAKIIKSNSHVDYVGRIIDRLDADDSPATEDYGFAQFVRLPVSERQDVVGVIYTTQLVNPDYGNFGPRLSPAPDLAVLSPDYLNEQGILVGMLLLGWLETEDDGATNASERQNVEAHQTVPRRVVPVGADVFRLDDKEVKRFHEDRRGGLQLHYYSQVLTHARLFALPLLEAIIEQLEPLCSEQERGRLCVLKKSLVWQRTMNTMRL